MAGPSTSLGANGGCGGWFGQGADFLENEAVGSGGTDGADSREHGSKELHLTRVW